MRLAGARLYAPLLEVPSDICTSLTEFTTTSEPIHAHRAKVAEAIEGLRAQAP